MGHRDVVGLVAAVLLASTGIAPVAEDGIRDAQESRGLGDVYKRQWLTPLSELGSVRDAHLEQQWSRDEQGAEHRPQCGLGMC